MDSLLLLARLLLAGTFAVAGVAKLADAEGSRKAVADFGLPTRAARPLGRLLPLSELVVALTLLPATSAWWGALGSEALLGLFMGAIGWNLAHGRTPDCHCFGQVHSEPAGWSTFTRNGALAALAGWVLWQGPRGAGPSAVAWLTELSPAGVVGVLAGAAGLLLLGGAAWYLAQLTTAAALVAGRLQTLDQHLATARLEGNPAAPAITTSLVAPPATATPTSIGALAPAFRLNGLQGETLGLDGLLAAGRSVLLVFVDPQCGPCTALMPEVARWQRERLDLTVAVITRGDARVNRTKVTEYGLRLVLLQTENEVAAAYQVAGTPAAILVGPDGRIASALALGPDAIRLLVGHAATTAAPGLPGPAPGVPIEPAPDAPEPGRAARDHAAGPRPHPAVAATTVDDDVIVYDPRTGQGHVLNETAAHVWRLLDGERSTAVLAQSLAERYNLPATQALDDVSELVDDLRQAGLVEV